MVYRILFIDEENGFLPKLTEYGTKKRFNYKFFSINSKVDATEYVLNNAIDLILLSCSLTKEGKTGLDYIKTLKYQTSTNSIPVILYTPNVTVDEYIKGLNTGADDCFNNTFPIDLLFSKMNAILIKINKDRNNKNNMLRKFHFIDDSLEVQFNDQSHKLTNKEFIILKILVENPNKVFSQEELNKLTSGEDVFVSRRCIDTFITLLRKKFGKNTIISVRKKGYKINSHII